MADAITQVGGKVICKVGNVIKSVAGIPVLQQPDVYRVYPGTVNPTDNTCRCAQSQVVKVYRTFFFLQKSDSLQYYDESQLYNHKYYPQAYPTIQLRKAPGYRYKWCGWYQYIGNRYFGDIKSEINRLRPVTCLYNYGNGYSYCMQDKACAQQLGRLPQLLNRTQLWSHLYDLGRRIIFQDGYVSGGNVYAERIARPQQLNSEMNLSYCLGAYNIVGSDGWRDRQQTYSWGVKQMLVTDFKCVSDINLRGGQICGQPVQADVEKKRVIKWSFSCETVPISTSWIQIQGGYKYQEDTRQCFTSQRWNNSVCVNKNKKVSAPPIEIKSGAVYSIKLNSTGAYTDLGCRSSAEFCRQPFYDSPNGWSQVVTYYAMYDCSQSRSSVLFSLPQQFSSRGPVQQLVLYPDQSYVNKLNFSSIIVPGDDSYRYRYATGGYQAADYLYDKVGVSADATYPYKLRWQPLSDNTSSIQTIGPGFYAPASSHVILDIATLMQTNCVQSTFPWWFYPRGSELYFFSQDSIPSSSDVPDYIKKATPLPTSALSQYIQTDLQAAPLQQLLSFDVYLWSVSKDSELGRQLLGQSYVSRSIIQRQRLMSQGTTTLLQSSLSYRELVLYKHQGRHVVQYIRSNFFILAAADIYHYLVVPHGAQAKYAWSGEIISRYKHTNNSGGQACCSNYPYYGQSVGAQVIRHWVNETDNSNYCSFAVCRYIDYKIPALLPSICTQNQSRWDNSTACLTGNTLNIQSSYFCIPQPGSYYQARVFGGPDFPSITPQMCTAIGQLAASYLMSHTYILRGSGDTMPAAMQDEQDLYQRSIFYVSVLTCRTGRDLGTSWQGDIPYQPQIIPSMSINGTSVQFVCTGHSQAVFGRYVDYTFSTAPKAYIIRYGDVIKLGANQTDPLGGWLRPGGYIDTVDVSWLASSVCKWDVVDADGVRHHYQQPYQVVDPGLNALQSGVKAILLTGAASQYADAGSNLD